MEDHPVLLVSRDPALVETAMAAAAAAGTTLDVVRDPAVVRARWRGSPVVLVGVEMAPLVCGIALEPRPDVHLLGGSLAELAAWSAPLQASVLLLPDHSALLTDVLGRGRQPVGDALVVRVLGGSGGVGASTVACALAQQAVRRATTAAVVELDPCGGGLDVLLGAEEEPGWRWPDLRHAVGRVDSLVGSLPSAAGVDVVSHARPEPDQPPAGLPSAEAVRAVIASLTRTHSLVVLDAGLAGEGSGEGWPGQRQVLVCGADVRQVVAARQRIASRGWHDVELVVRVGAGRPVEPQAVADGLGLPLLGVVRDDRRVTRAAEQGIPVGRGRRGFDGQVGAILDGLVA